MKLAPSILAADLADLTGAIRVCEAGKADMLHLDVMDGHFVPNLTFGIPVIEALRSKTRLPLDVHLMVSNPERLLHAYLDADPQWVSVHWEAAPHLDRLLEQIRSKGVKAGVALNPSTPVELLNDVLCRLDFVLLMSVNPGFSGQKFLPYVLEKARRLRAMLDAASLRVKIEMDGGIGPGNIRQVAVAGVDMCVMGSSVFSSSDPARTLDDLRSQSVGDL